MHIAIISDLHSDTKALKAVLQHIQEVAPQAPIICLGDLYECTIGKKRAQTARHLPLDKAALYSEKFQKLLRFLTIRGNQEERIALVTGLEQFNRYPETITIDNARFIHGHQFEWTPEWTAIFPHYEERVIFFGHSHQAAYYENNSRTIAKPNELLQLQANQIFVNVGSVVDHLEWVLYDVAQQTVLFQKVGH